MLRWNSLFINNTGFQIDINQLIPGDHRRYRYDILCSHVVFNYRELIQYFHSDTVYIGVVRDPFRQFLSSFVYFSPWDDNLKRVIAASPDNPVEEFLNHSSKYLKDIKPSENMLDNRMSVDFGFPEDDFEGSKQNKSKISAFLNDIDNKFLLVMVSEMFDESLVLMRRLLNWTTKDIIYINVNVFKPGPRTPSWALRKEYPDYVHRKFETFAALDIALYDKFVNILKEKIRSQPKDFFSEVRKFKELQKAVIQTCEKGDYTLPRVFPATEHTSEVVLTHKHCEYMKLSERQIFHRAQAVQKRRFFSGIRNSPRTKLRSLFV